MSRLDPMAVGWGGLCASIGLIAAAGRDWPVRLTVTAVTFGLGGFLAGVRADGRRRAHALAAAAAAYAIDAAFVAGASIIDGAGGPDAPSLTPGGGRAWLFAAAWAFGFALIGGLVVDTWLRPASRRASE